MQLLPLSSYQKCILSPPSLFTEAQRSITDCQVRWTSLTPHWERRLVEHLEATQQDQRSWLTCYVSAPGLICSLTPYLPQWLLEPARCVCKRITFNLGLYIFLQDVHKLATHIAYRLERSEHLWDEDTDHLFPSCVQGYNICALYLCSFC